jgi:hypothetical protein
LKDARFNEMYFKLVAKEAVETAWAVQRPCTEPFVYLVNASLPNWEDARLRVGATYKSLAYIAHLFEMDDNERRHWYEFANDAPLSQAHASLIIARVNALRERCPDTPEDLLARS